MCLAENTPESGLDPDRNSQKSTDQRQFTQRRRKRGCPGSAAFSGLRRGVQLSKVFLYLNLLFAFTVFVRCETELDEDSDFEPPSTSVDVTSQNEDILNTALHFTSPIYSATIPENSVGKVYVVPENSRMGIQSNDSTVSIRYRIKSGDQDNFFKAEAERVGDFIFLMIRTRTNNLDVLNRERRASYRLDIRARVKGPDQRKVRTPEAKTIVNIEVTDSNDLDPFFQPSTYFFDVPEDTALHSTFGSVRAEDADSGINGEIYYSLVDNEGSEKMFAVDPVTGGISVTRPLSFRDKPRHELTVIAQDRGAKSRFATRAPDTATVHIAVTQVRLGPVSNLTNYIEESSLNDVTQFLLIFDTP